MITNQEVPNLTTAQHRALTAGVNDPDGRVRPGAGISARTLRGLTVPRKGLQWADPVDETTVEDGRKVTRFAGIQLRPSGRSALALFNAQRETTERNARVIRQTIAQRAADPFAVVAAVNPRELAIMF